MADNLNTFASYVPKDCPPRNAVSIDIEDAYRLTLNDPPQSDDFLSHVESKKRFPPDKTCEACAVSLFLNYEDIKNTKKKVPAYKNKGYVAKGIVYKNTGVVSPPSKTSHVNWWIFKGTSVHHFFQTVK